MIKQIDITNNKLTAIIEDSDTNLMLVVNLANLEGTIIATIWWSGVEGVKNIYLVPNEVLSTYIYKGSYGTQKITPTPFGETVLNVVTGAEMAVNAIATSNAVNWSNETKNATLTLLDGTCLAFDAVVIRANQQSWQVMLAGDALTKLSLIA